MSDIGLPSGLAFFLGALLTLAIGAASLLLALIVGLLLPHTASETLPMRLLRFAQGPLLCLLVGVIGLLLVSSATQTFDDWWFACPTLAVVCGGMLTVSKVRAYRASAPRFSLK